jgi:hypothetical protein
MEDLLHVIVGVLSSIIVAGGALAVAYFRNFEKRLSEANASKKQKDLQIYSLQNGFRTEVYERLGELEIKINKLVTHCEEQQKRGV